MLSPDIRSLRHCSRNRNNMLLLYRITCCSGGLGLVNLRYDLRCHLVGLLLIGVADGSNSELRLNREWGGYRRNGRVSIKTG